MRITHPTLRSLQRFASPLLVASPGRSTVPALVALLMAGACSSGSESADTSGGLVVTTKGGSVPATDVAGRPITTTTGPATTGPPPTAGVAGATLPSSTMLSRSGSEDALHEAIGDAELALLGALRDPRNEQLLNAVEAATAPDSPARAELVSRYHARVSAGYALEPGSSQSAVVLESSGPFVEGGEAAVVTVCVVDGDVLVRHQVAGDGDADTIVIDDEPDAARFVETFVLVDGQWRLKDRVVTDYFAGGASCSAMS